MGKTVAPLGSADRALVALALDTDRWSMEEARRMQDAGPNAMLRLKAMARPAKDVEPGGVVDGARGARTDRLIKAVQMLGAKIAPSMPDEQSFAWVTAVVMALSDLPFAFAQKGAEDAIHVPMRFLNEVETAVREKAKDAEARHKLAVMRLERMQREIASASQPKLEAPKPMTPEEYQEELNGTDRFLLDLWFRNDIITLEQFNTAIAAQGKDENGTPTAEQAADSGSHPAEARPAGAGGVDDGSGRDDP